MQQTNGSQPQLQSNSHALNNGLEGQHYSRPQEDETENDQSKSIYFFVHFKTYLCASFCR